MPLTLDCFRYILDDIKTNSAGANFHWRPQYLCCPFCLLNFTVYSRIEDLDQDAFYFFNNSGLSDRVDLETQINQSQNASTGEKQFWQEVDMDLVDMLEEPWAFMVDFSMFDYSADQYLKQLDLNYVII